MFVVKTLLRNHLSKLLPQNQAKENQQPNFKIDGNISTTNSTFNGYPFMSIITKPHEKIPDTFFQVKKIGIRFLGQKIQAKKSRPNLLEKIKQIITIAPHHHEQLQIDK